MPGKSPNDNFHLSNAKQPISLDVKAMPSVDKNKLVKKLFEKTLAKLGIQGLDKTSPSIFLIYAHDNHDAKQNPNKTPADGKIGEILIHWLHDLGLKIASDRTWIHNPQRPDVYEQCKSDILRNQLKIISGHEQSVEKVILCGSQLLTYYIDTAQYYRDYSNKIASAINRSDRKVDDLYATLSQIIPRDPKDSFHHVITEILFLKHRLLDDKLQSHYVPIVLNMKDKNVKTTFPQFVLPQDVYIETMQYRTAGHWGGKDIYENEGLYQGFFELLERLFVGKKNEEAIIKRYKTTFIEGVNQIRKDVIKMTILPPASLLQPFNLQAQLKAIQESKSSLLDLSSYRLVDTKVEAKLNKTLMNGDLVHALALLPDGRLAVSEGKNIKLWNVLTGACVQTLEGQCDTVVALTVLSNSRLAVSDGKNIKLWDVSTSHCVGTLKGHSDKVVALTVLPDGCLASGSLDKTIRLWDVMTGNHKILQESAEVTVLAKLPNGHLSSSSKDKTIKVWNVLTGKCEQTLKGHSDIVLAFATLPDGRLVSGSKDMTIKVWNISTGQCDKTLEGHEDPVFALTILPNGRLASGSWENKIKLWDVSTWSCKRTSEGHNDTVSALVVLPDGRLVSGSRDKTIKLWQVQNKFLNLQWNDVKPLLSILSQSTIKQVNLQHVKLIDACVPELLQAVGTSQIKHLDISNTDISKTGVKVLYEGCQKVQPSLQIEHAAMSEVLANVPKNTINVGEDDFCGFVEAGRCVDKTLFIKELLVKQNKVSLIIRPRRFGKTLNMTMLDHFFNIARPERALFNNFRIWTEENGRYQKKYYHQYPVLFVTFKGVSGETYEKAFASFKSLVAEKYGEYYPFLYGTLEAPDQKLYNSILEETANELNTIKAFKYLTKYLEKRYTKKVIVLIDEYDTPLHNAYEAKPSYHEPLEQLLNRVFEELLKTNEAVGWSVLTGIHRISKGSIFSKLNIVTIYSAVDDRFAEYFGFQSHEVEDLFKGMLQQPSFIQDIEDWYGGYRIGQNITVCNPWSVSKLFSEYKPDKKAEKLSNLPDYWLSSAQGSQKIQDLIIKRASSVSKYSVEFKASLKTLLQNQSIETEISVLVVFNQIEDSVEALWSFMLLTGYLAVSECQELNPGSKAVKIKLTIPNKELFNFYEQHFGKKWFPEEKFHFENKNAIYRTKREEKKVEEEKQKVIRIKGLREELAKNIGIAKLLPVTKLLAEGLRDKPIIDVITNIIKTADRNESISVDNLVSEYKLERNSDIVDAYLSNLRHVVQERRQKAFDILTAIYKDEKSSNKLTRTVLQNLQDNSQDIRKANTKFLEDIKEEKSPESIKTYNQNIALPGMVRIEAIEALFKYGEIKSIDQKAIDGLVENIAIIDNEVSGATFMLIQKHHNLDDKKVVAAYLQSLKSSPNEGLRTNAIEAIKCMKFNEYIRNALLTHLDENNAVVRRQSQMLLSGFGQDAVVMETRVRQLNFPDAEIRQEAVEYIYRKDPQSAAQNSHLHNALRRNLAADNEAIRQKAEQMLRAFGKLKEEKTYEQYRRNLDNDALEIRLEAVEALNKIAGALFKDDIEAAVIKSLSAETVFRGRIIKLLDSFKLKDSPQVENIYAVMLEHTRNADMRREAAEFLVTKGDKHREKIADALIKNIKSDVDDTEREKEKTLIDRLNIVSTHADKLETAYVENLQNPKAKIRLEAIDALFSKLNKIVQYAERAKIILIDIISEDEDIPNILKAIQLLELLGAVKNEDNTLIVSALLRIERNSSADNLKRVIPILVGYGKDNKDVDAVLCRRMQDKNLEIKLIAIKYAGDIPKPSEDLRRNLEKAKLSEIKIEASAAEGALNKINSRKRDGDDDHSIVSKLPPAEGNSVMSSNFSEPTFVQQLRSAEQPNLNEELQYYIPVNGCWHNNYNSNFDLETKVEEFLRSDKKVLLLLGNSGAGKTLFCQYLMLKLSQQKILSKKKDENQQTPIAATVIYKTFTLQANPAIVLYVSLAGFPDPAHDLIEKKLKRVGLNDKEINYLKDNQQPFVLILDGYDEISRENGLYQNLYATNKLGEWNARVIISCQSQFLLNANNHRNHFVPIENEIVNDNLFIEIYLVPFSDEQIKKYIEKYLSKAPEARMFEGREWKTEHYCEYIDRLPGLKALITTPFLLRILMEILPQIVKDYENVPFAEQQVLTVVKICDYFTQSYFERSLAKVASKGHLPEDGSDLMEDYKEFCEQLAKAMTLNGLVQVVYKPAPRPLVTLYAITASSSENPWEVFFGDTNEHIKRVRAGCPIRLFTTAENDSTQCWGFIHPMLRDYFVSRQVFKESLKGEIDIQGIKQKLYSQHKENTDAKTVVVTPINALISNFNENTRVMRDNKVRATPYIKLEQNADIHNVVTQELIIAVRNNDAKEVERLLNMGADVNAMMEAKDEKVQLTYPAPLLLYSIKAHRLPIVDILLQNKEIDIRKSNPTGFSPLLAAAREGFYDLVVQLIQMKAGIDQTHNIGWDAFDYAVEQGHLPIVQYLHQLTKNRDINNDKNSNTDTPLATACMQGRFEVVKYLVKEAKADVNKGCRNTNYSPLMFAAQQRSIELVNLLLDNKAEVNHTSNEGWTALMLVCGEKYHLPIVQRLLLAGANVNAVTTVDKTNGKGGNTALHNACSHADVTIVDALLKAGAKVNALTAEGRTPLYFAAVNNKPLIIKRLMEEKDLDCNLTSGDTRWMMSPLNTASLKGHVEVVKLLLTIRNINVNQDDVLNDYPLIGAVTNNNIDVVKLLLNVPGINVNCSRINGDTSLSIARASGFKVIETLLVAHPKINDSDKKLPLIGAARNGNIEKMKKLVQANVDINETNENEETALYIACVNNQLAAVTYLLNQADVDVNLPNSKGFFPLYIAALRGHVLIVKALSEHPQININQRCYGVDGGATSLFTAAANKCLEVVKILLEVKNIDVNQARIHRGNDGRNPLIAASGIKKTDSVEDIAKATEIGCLLIKHPKIDVNVQSANWAKAWSPLLNAATNGNEKLVKALLEHPKINVNIQTTGGYTALAQAACGNHLSCMRLLLKAPGIRVNLTAEKDLTPLMCAVSNGHEGAVQLLLDDKRTNLEAEDDKKKTVIFYAASKGFLPIVKLLIKYGVNVFHTSDEGLTPCNVALQDGHIVVAKFLKETEDQISQQEKAKQSKLQQDITTAEQKKLQVAHVQKTYNKDTKQTYVSRTAAEQKELNDNLCKAVFNRDEKKVRVFLKEGAEINTTWSNLLEPEYTPLSLATWRADVKMIKFLLSEGADIHCNSKQILIYAALNQRTNRLGNPPKGMEVDPLMQAETMEALLRAGADPNVIDFDDVNKLTPLNISIWLYNRKCMELLVGAGANLFRKDAHGKNAFDTAREHNGGVALPLLKEIYPNARIEELQIKLREAREKAKSNLSIVTSAASDQENAINNKQILLTHSKVHKQPNAKENINEITQPINAAVVTRYLPENHEALGEINVTGDGSCLPYSIVLSYLVPVLNNVVQFQARCIALFGRDKITDTAITDLSEFLKTYNGEKDFITTNHAALEVLVDTTFRQRFMRYMRDHKAEFEGFIEENFETYLTKQAKPKQWCGDPEIKAISAMLQIRIEIYNPIASNQLSTSKQIHGANFSDTIRLVHADGGTHYHYLIPLGLLKQKPQTAVASLNLPVANLSSGNADTKLLPVTNLAEKNVASSLLLKKQRANEDSRTIHKTKGSGDCGFHAILGELNGDQYECKDIQNLRTQLAKAVREAKEGSAIFTLIKAGFEAFIMDDGIQRGPLIAKIRQDYLHHLDANAVQINQAWLLFEAKLNHYPDILNYIQQTVTEQDKQNKKLKTKSDIFQFCLNKSQGNLRLFIQIEKELDAAFIAYKQLSNADFPLGQKINQAVINEYATYLEKPGNWLLPLELNLIANVFNRRVNLYTRGLRGQNPAQLLDTFNSTATLSVELQFNGSDHYERVTQDNNVQATLEIKLEQSVDTKFEANHDKTLQGHSNIVHALTLLSDGRLASGSDDHSIKLWDVKTGECEQTLSGHSYGVNALLLLSDGRLASGSGDKTIKLWDVKTGMCEQTLSGHSDLVCSLTQLSDGRLASGSRDNTIKLWDTKTGVCARTLSGHSYDVYALTQLSDGRLASGSSDNTIKLWAVKTGACEQTLSGRSSQQGH